MKENYNQISKKELEELINSESTKKMRKLMQKEKEVREVAGIYMDEGRVDFNCPNCGTLVVSHYIWHKGELHGGIHCEGCKVGVRH